MAEIHSTDREKSNASLKDRLIGVATIFTVVAVFGYVADRVFGSEAKEREARKQGYDI